MKTTARIPFETITTLQPKDQQTILRGLKLLIESSDLMYRFNLQSADDILQPYNQLRHSLKEFFILSNMFPNKVSLRFIISFANAFKNLSELIKGITNGQHTQFSSALLAVGNDFEKWFEDAFECLEGQK